MALSNKTLYGKFDKMKKSREATYDIIYKRCLRAIQNRSSVGYLDCEFEIPKIILGTSMPVINLDACSIYLIDKLTKLNSNLKITSITEDRLLIDWRREIDS
jgi:hypothetical protein